MVTILQVIVDCVTTMTSITRVIDTLWVNHHLNEWKPVLEVIRNNVFMLTKPLDLGGIIISENVDKIVELLLVMCPMAVQILDMVIIRSSVYNLTRHLDLGDILLLENVGKNVVEVLDLQHHTNVLVLVKILCVFNYMRLLVLEHILTIRNACGENVSSVTKSFCTGIY